MSNSAMSKNKYYIKKWSTTERTKIERKVRVVGQFKLSQSDQNPVPDSNRKQNRIPISGLWSPKGKEEQGPIATRRMYNRPSRGWKGYCTAGTSHPELLYSPALIPSPSIFIEYFLSENVILTHFWKVFLIDIAHARWLPNVLPGRRLDKHRNEIPSTSIRKQT